MLLVLYTSPKFNVKSQNSLHHLKAIWTGNLQTQSNLKHFGAFQLLMWLLGNRAEPHLPGYRSFNSCPGSATFKFVFTNGNRSLTGAYTYVWSTLILHSDTEIGITKVCALALKEAKHHPVRRVAPNLLVRF